MNCAECDRLRIEFDRIVRLNSEVLCEYSAAVLMYDQETVASLLTALHEVELLRAEARIRLAFHEETHSREIVMIARQ